MRVIEYVMNAFHRRKQSWINDEKQDKDHDSVAKFKCFYLQHNRNIDTVVKRTKGAIENWILKNTVFYPIFLSVCIYF